ncbi:MAG: Hsp20/alpha crystallin family protein [Desulfobacterales bacterium]|nr:Hsp20/alpha crystallin family protein [Desulfobacterales bacterium]
MSTIKIRFADEIEALGAKVERAVEDMFRSFSPVFNLAEDKDDLEVEISTRAVRIRATRNPRYCNPDATYRLAEIQYGRFERILFLPAPIDPEIVSASYANGMLEIRLARQPMDPIHPIKVTEG